MSYLYAGSDIQKNAGRKYDETEIPTMLKCKDVKGTGDHDKTFKIKSVGRNRRAYRKSIVISGTRFSLAIDTGTQHEDMDKQKEIPPAGTL